MSPPSPTLPPPPPAGAPLGPVPWAGDSVLMPAGVEEVWRGEAEALDALDALSEATEWALPARGDTRPF